jgi:glyoxylase I family protein
MFKRIDHVEIVTDEPARTEAFYTEVLGFRVTRRDRVETAAGAGAIDIVYLDLGGTGVELISYGSQAVAPAPAAEHLGYRMMALEVADMRAALDYLSARGVEAVWGPRYRQDYARAEIRDPNGYHIELRQWFR